jgi:hypothetical protein
VIYNLEGSAVKRYPYVDCWAKASLASSNRWTK